MMIEALVVWLVGWLPAAVYIARLDAEPGPPEPHCHGETKPKGGNQGLIWNHVTMCRAYCKPGCWRAEPAPERKPVSTQSSFWGVAGGIFWPLLAPVWLVKYLANRPPRSARRSKLTEAQVREIERRMEREAGVPNLPD